MCSDRFWPEADIAAKAQNMTRWWKSPLGIAALLVASAVLAFFGPLDYALKYLHFSALTKERLMQETHTYIRDRAGGDQMACLYVVQCDGDRARLELVQEIDSWDFDAAKNRIWRRRFSNYCTGRTTNLALHLIPHEGHEPQIDALAHARWSFFNDRFIPLRGRFQSGAFTDQPWERCTPEAAIVR
jgi:hypothetical protein